MEQTSYISIVLAEAVVEIDSDLVNEDVDRKNYI